MQTEAFDLGSWYDFLEYIEQADNHHASNFKFTKQISTNQIFISRYNCVQGDKCWNM